MRVVKSISFNVRDPFENMMIEHFKKYPNFSNYVKRLIQRDIEGVTNTSKAVQLEFQEEKPDDNEDLMSLMM